MSLSWNLCRLLSNFFTLVADQGLRYESLQGLAALITVFYNLKKYNSNGFVSHIQTPLAGEGTSYIIQENICEIAHPGVSR